MSRLLNPALAVPHGSLSPWIIILAGLSAIYLPSFIDLFQGAWSSEKNAHGPIVMVVAFCFVYFRVRQMLAQDLFERAPAPVAGSVLMGFGLLGYAVGRSQSVLLLEVGSLVVVLTGVVVAFFGVRTWSRMWFAFFFMLFMIPLPASVVDVVTLPLKLGVSYATEHLLYWMGYPIARSGVILIIGQYQLLVADACAGLNSLFTLEALGLLYMNLVRHPSVVRNVLLAMLIIPISFAANTIRIVFLALITYYMGDAAGQGFLHGFSGLVLFLSALLLIIGVDGFLSRMVRQESVKDQKTLLVEAQSKPRLKMPGAWQHTVAVTAKPALAMMVAMLLTVGAAYALTPVVVHAKTTASLAASVPKQFGEWTEVPSLLTQADLSPAADGGKNTDQPYDDVLMRTYVNRGGAQLMLALAYSKEQRQDVKIHLPEICYLAQGYRIINQTPARMAVLPNGATLPGKHLLAINNNRMEAVSYWVRIGDAYPQGGLAMRIKIFRDGMAGSVTDGILVRASMLIREDADAGKAYAVQERFLAQLIAAANRKNHSLVAE